MFRSSQSSPQPLSPIKQRSQRNPIEIRTELTRAKQELSRIRVKVKHLEEELRDVELRRVKLHKAGFRFEEPSLHDN